MNEKLLWISDFSVIGSGYLNISVPICQGLAELGYEIKVLGIGYKGEQHPYDFSIIPIQSEQEVLAISQNIYNYWDKGTDHSGFDACVVALDIPMQERLLAKFVPKPFKYVGIMPVEAPPLTLSWAMVLMGMDKQFIISQFGTDECHRMGIMTAEHLPVGIDTKAWRPPEEVEVKALKSNFGFSEDTFVVLTVADNQERKNLARSMEIFADFMYQTPFVNKEKIREEKLEPKIDARYVLVTREHLGVGWKLLDYAQELGIHNQFIVVERGIPFNQLWGMYALSDAFLLTSKAEGLCVLPNSQVKVYSGYKKIQDISIGEHVLAHTGKWQIVTKVFSRNYSGNIYKVNMGFGLDSIKATPNHLIYAIKRKNRKLLSSSPEWMPINELEKGDFIFYPKQKTTSDYISINVSSRVRNSYIDGEYVYLIGRNQFGSVFKHPATKPIKNNVYINKQFMSLLGYYISEGCKTKDGVCFSFHEKEKEYHQEVINALDSLFSISCKEESKSRNRHILWVRSRILGEFFSSLCGKSSHEKIIPEFAFDVPDDLAWELIRTMFYGDGNFNRKTQYYLRYSTVSRKLAEQLQILLFNLGVVSSLKSQKNRIEYTVTIYHPELFNVSFINRNEIPEIKKHQSQYKKLSNGYLFPIRNIETEQYSGKVYNLEVDSDNSYTVGGLAIHNCMPILEAMSCKLPVLATNSTGPAELLDDGRGILIDYVDDSDLAYIDPFGNSYRYFAKRSDGFEKLTQLWKNGFDTEPAWKYVQDRTWDKAVTLVDQYFRNLE